MLPEAFAANTSFLDVSQFCHTGNIVSVGKNVSAVKQKPILLEKNSVSHVAKLGNIEETCVRSKCFWQHVSSFYQVLN